MYEQIAKLLEKYSLVGVLETMADVVDDEIMLQNFKDPDVEKRINGYTGEPYTGSELSYIATDLRGLHYKLTHI